MTSFSKKLITGFSLLAIIGGLVYWWFHPTHYLYNDRFIKGRDMEAITQRYGEFDVVFYHDQEETKISSAGYRTRSRMKGYMDAIPEQFYLISFDKEGRATTMRLETNEL